MYQTCPKCQYERTEQDQSDAGICPGCGLVFAKWLKQQYADPASQPRSASFDYVNDDGGGRVAATLDELRRLVLHAEPAKDSLTLYARLVLLAAFAVWGLYFIGLDFETNAIGQSFMHRINLVFHEAGHVIFSIFGSHFITTLGGTLGQLLMPVIVMFTLLFTNRDPYGAAFGLWWLGQSFMDCAPYINDARALELQLLGGGTGADKPGMHDWENILLDLGMIEHDHQVATLFDLTGAALVLLASAWAGYILYRQYRLMS